MTGKLNDFSICLFLLVYGFLLAFCAVKAGLTLILGDFEYEPVNLVIQR